MSSEIISSEDMLRFLLERDNLSFDGVIEDYMAQKRDQIIKDHPYAIFKSKDGRYRTYIKDSDGKRKMIAKSSREKIEEEIINAHNLKKKASETLESLYPSWIKHKALHVENTTVDRVKKDWRKYYEHSEIVKKPIPSLTKLDLDEWIHSMIRKYQMNNHRYGNFILILRQELNYAVDLGIISDSPLNSVKVDKKRVLVPEFKKDDELEVFSEEELGMIYEKAHEDYLSGKRPKHKLVPLAVIFLFQTGLRLGEVSALRFEDVKGDEILVRRMVRYPRGEILSSTKGTYGSRSVPLTPKAVDIIKTSGTEGYIFSPSGEPILTYVAIQKAFTKYCKELGLLHRGAHKARKTYISKLLDSGININTVRTIAGHQDEQTTLRNYCYDSKSKDERISQIISAIV